MKYKQALQKLPSDFKRMYGVTPETFWKMVQVVRNAKQGSRGSYSKLSIPDQILLTLQYWREYRTLFYIAQDWGVHESTAQRTVKRIENMLIKSQEFSLPSQREMSKNDTEIELVIIDVAETEIERPKKNRSNTIAASKNAIR
jgi:hypothetical protein